MLLDIVVRTQKFTDVTLYHFFCSVRLSARQVVEVHPEKNVLPADEVMSDRGREIAEHPFCNGVF